MTAEVAKFDGQAPAEVRASALAKVLGLSTDRLRALHAEGVVIRTRRGYYDLARSVQGYVDYWRRRAEQNTTPEDEYGEKLRALKLRQQEADTLTAELTFQQKIESLYPVNAIADAWSSAQLVAKQQLLAVPGKMRGRYALDPEVIAHLGTLIEDALNELARADPFPEVE